MFGEVKTIKLPGDSDGIAFDKADSKILETSNNTLSKSKSSNKSTYTSWIRHFDIRIGNRNGQWNLVRGGAFILASYMVHSAKRLRGCLNSYVFPS